MKAKTFGDELQEIRHEQALSQSGASEAWGVSIHTLQGWEIGKAVPSDFVQRCILFYLRHCKKKRG